MVDVVEVSIEEDRVAEREVAVVAGMELEMVTARTAWSKRKTPWKVISCRTSNSQTRVESAVDCSHSILTLLMFRVFEG